MNYQNIEKGIFIARPNRFIAEIEIGGKREICHVKNTGRLKELLLPGAVVWCEKSQNPARKTAYDLIAVEHADQVINIDSQAPNKIAAEWLPQSGLFPADTRFRSEVRRGSNRFDFLAEWADGECWIEVKGITLNDRGVARFPDAPTERGVRHLEHLAAIAGEGGNAMVLFIIAMKGVTAVAPNDTTHKAFGDALRNAAEEGVQIEAVDCIVKPDEIIADQRLPVILST